ncbi:hypothetical protein AWB68_07780 [Caballeronia choica]|uniref:Uncharacterized protein n=1 Tax=Caballeronia choica TaxID=326476 RepID=A0A158KYA3_9BURK|nr:hypothetical protein [Caballeronia choica]SAL85719.1 hypothetical protein AWB68_07780 [Caballeronia choica]
MKKDDLAIERVKKIVEQAENLRMKSAAVPLSDLKTILMFCDLAKVPPHSEMPPKLAPSR